MKRLVELGIASNPAVTPALINRLGNSVWVEAGHPLCLIADSGTGESHLLITLGSREPSPVPS